MTLIRPSGPAPRRPTPILSAPRIIEALEANPALEEAVVGRFLPSTQTRLTLLTSERDQALAQRDAAVADLATAQAAAQQAQQEAAPWRALRERERREHFAAGLLLGVLVGIAALDIAMRLAGG